MKSHIRLISLLLIAVFLLSFCPQVSAVEKVFGNTTTPTSYFIYPAGDVIDATIPKGGYKDLVFFSELVPPSDPAYYYYIEIYRGSLDYLDMLVDQDQDPEVMDTFFFQAKEWWNKPKTARLTADSRYTAGDYSLVCCLVNVDTGEIMNPYELFWTELHVADNPPAATDFCMQILMADGLHEIQEGDIVFADSSYIYLFLTPGPIPSIGTQQYTISSALTGVVSTVAYKNFYQLEIKFGDYLTRVDITSGDIHHSFWMNTGNYDEDQVLYLKHGNTNLCVGAEDTCVVKGIEDNSHFYENYICAPDWSTSDPSVATVTSWGLVKALKPGTVTITAEAGRFKQSVTYTVREHQLPEGTPVTGPTATQPRQAVGHCSVCGKDDAVNIYEPAIFTDTVAASWYAQHVDLVYDLGLMNGTGAHKFSPDSPLTRAMAATVLYRIAGKPEVEGESPFPDVPAGQWYTEPVIWAQANGIVTGYQDGTFRPDRNITREQFAAILYRYMRTIDPELQPDADLSGFPDAGNVQSYALEAMRWAVGEKLINGVAVGEQSFLRPENNTTRAQFATIISRFMGVRERYTPQDEPDPDTPDPDAPAPAER